MSTQDEVRADVRAWLAEHWDPDAAAARLAPPARRQRLGHADVADGLVRPRACPAGPTPSWPRSSPAPAPWAPPSGAG